MDVIRRHLPRWFILVIDVFICFCSLIIAYLLRFNFVIPQVERVTFVYVFPLVLCLRGISFYISGVYKNIIRYTEARDVQQIVVVLTIVSLLLGLSNIVAYYVTPFKHFLVPYSIIMIEYLSTTFMLIAARLIYKALYAGAINPARTKRSIVIYGADEAGLIAKKAVERDAGTKYDVIGFIDEDSNKWNKRLEGITIYKPEELEWLLDDNNVAHLVMSNPDIDFEKKTKIIDICLRNGTKVLNVPPIDHWINGQLSFKQIKRVRIEDLLERDPIVLDRDKIDSQIRNKIILISGAAGSIGSEIVRQIIPFKPKKLILLDQAESPLYDLELELGEIPSVQYKAYIADICNKERIEHIFKTEKPEMVFHAAAYKHVPIMEENPAEAILVNVQGSKNLADLSVQFRVEKFVMVSTDKAVNPTGVMGASKRIAETYVQALSKKGKTRFVTTRFGNVLGSNGSVIPRFRQQIEKGGPLTITHPEITRFFMTIPEACQLVIEAGAIGQGGEIYVFDMGKSVKILDLAKKMIQLSGLTLDKDIKIVFTGLRPGEKLYEELLHNNENSLPTHHPQILIAKVKEYDYDTVSKLIDELINAGSKQNEMDIVKMMKQIVPEYLSNNSVFEQLDRRVASN
ncbi:MAG TPA: nucleoside-diphosphate sugar epimerase/dehydratase [Bacteroidia bacterium]|jgi:FlaA1/EpsC-like NDP-sugar epimerase|nr:nucleoside-diphosphate sugar epimerase/dehydratase [Bacteroidia bacterium]